MGPTPLLSEKIQSMSGCMEEAIVARIGEGLHELGGSWLTASKRAGPQGYNHRK